MSIYTIYLTLFVSSSYLGVALLSWTQMKYIHFRANEYLHWLPLTMTITTVLIIIDALIIYFYARPFDKLVNRIKSGGNEATLEEKQNALKTYKKMNTVTIISTIIGFIFGNGITILIKVLKGILPAEPNRIIIAMIQAVIFGAMASMYTVLVMNEKFSKYREMLKIHSLDEKERTTTISGTMALLITVTVLYIAVNMMIVPYQLIYLQKKAPLENAFSFYFANSIKMFFISVLTSCWPIIVILNGIKKRMQATAKLVNDFRS